MKSSFVDTAVALGQAFAAVSRFEKAAFAAMAEDGPDDSFEDRVVLTLQEKAEEENTQRKSAQ